jgi:hypothetical protein
MNSNAYQGLIESHIRQRQLAIWNKIIQMYEIEDSLNTQVHKWIEEGTVSEKATKLTGKGIKSAVLRDDMPTAHPY